MDLMGKPLRVAVVGAGGVGGLLGALLTRTGDQVTFVATDATASVLNERGLRVQSERFGTFTVPTTAVTALTSPVDVTLVAVKAMELDAALERVPVQVLTESALVPLLNGVEHVDALRRRYGGAVVAGTVRVASTRTAPGVIEHTSPFLRVELAPPGASDDHHRALAQHLGRRLTAAGAEVEFREDELSMLWGKLIFLCPLALITTRYAISAGDVRTVHREELVAVIDEIAAVAGALGASLSAGGALDFFDSVPSTMQSSMQHDAANGKPIELDAIGGAVLRAGERAGVPVPVTRRLVGELSRKTKGTRGPGS